MKISKSVRAKVQAAIYIITAFLDLGANFKNPIAILGNTNRHDQKLYHPLYDRLTIWYIVNCLQKSISQLIERAITIIITKWSTKVSLCFATATVAIPRDTTTIIQYGT